MDSEINKQIKIATRLVQKMPPWKRNILVQSGQSTVRVPRTPVNNQENPSRSNKMKVQIIIHLFQGVIDDVLVFTKEKDVLDYLCGEIGEDFKNEKDFLTWQSSHSEEDSEYRWFENSLIQ